MITIKIGGAFRHAKSIMKILLKYNTISKFNIIVYDSFSDCLLSGGRINYFSAHYDEKIHQLYSKLGIKFSLIISNNKFSTMFMTLIL